MKARFTQSFKIQAVEKALNRTEETSLLEIAETLGVGYSTLGAPPKIGQNLLK